MRLVDEGAVTEDAYRDAVEQILSGVPLDLTAMITAAEDKLRAQGVAVVDEEATGLFVRPEFDDDDMNDFSDMFDSLLGGGAQTPGRPAVDTSDHTGVFVKPTASAFLAGTAVTERPALDPDSGEHLSVLTSDITIPNRRRPITQPQRSLRVSSVPNYQPMPMLPKTGGADEDTLLLDDKTQEFNVDAARRARLRDQAAPSTSALLARAASADLAGEIDMDATPIPLDPPDNLGTLDEPLLSGLTPVTAAASETIDDNEATAVDLDITTLAGGFDVAAFADETQPEFDITSVRLPTDKTGQLDLADLMMEAEADMEPELEPIAALPQAPTLEPLVIPSPRSDVTPLAFSDDDDTPARLGLDIPKPEPGYQQRLVPKGDVRPMRPSGNILALGDGSDGDTDARWVWWAAAATIALFALLLWIILR